MGVFATRSPFRPNKLGLSCVRLLDVAHTEKYGTVLHVGGADLMDGTPIFDIKPYIPYSDCKPDASGGFTERVADFLLDVDFPEELLKKLPSQKQDAAIGVLSHCLLLLHLIQGHPPLKLLRNLVRALVAQNPAEIPQYSLPLHRFGDKGYIFNRHALMPPFLCGVSTYSNSL